MDAVRPCNAPIRKEVKTILLVEDDCDFRELMTRILLTRGFQVHQAACVRTAYELATLCKPDLLILDLALPHGDGTQLVEQLRAQPQTESLPIFVHTGSILNDEERQRLAPRVQSITSKTESERLLENLDRMHAPNTTTVLDSAFA